MHTLAAAKHTQPTHNNPTKKQGPHATAAVLFIIVCFTIGLATQQFLDFIPIPYTAKLLLIGLAIGALQAIPPATHQFTDALYWWLNFEPHLLLLVFLPAIGFSAGISQQPHLIRHNWPTMLLLALPGVIITFILIAVCARYFFQYGWTWPESLLFGAMVRERERGGA